MKKIKGLSLIFATGAVLYSIIEILWRGYTHISMAFAGGSCLLGLYGCDTLIKKSGRVKKCLVGTALITAVEFIFGCIFNKLLGLNVWDYSDRFLNLWGQVCPLFSFFWFILCFPAFWLCGRLRKLIQKR